jgi:hypothetical protein
MTFRRMTSVWVIRYLHLFHPHQLSENVTEATCIWMYHQYQCYVKSLSGTRSCSEHSEMRKLRKDPETTLYFRGCWIE